MHHMVPHHHNTAHQGPLPSFHLELTSCLIYDGRWPSGWPWGVASPFTMLSFNPEIQQAQLGDFWLWMG